MDFNKYVEQWKDKEVIAFCGSVKYRGVLADVLDGGFVILSNVAIVNPVVQETSEYDNCVLNISQISGLACEEFTGRGVDEMHSY